MLTGGAKHISVWPPTAISSVVQVIETSSRPVHAITNGGAVFAKFIGNPQGPHVLAAEVLGIECAKLLGIPTFDYCIADFTAAEVAKVDLKALEETENLPAQPGAAFVTRLHEGDPWDGHETSLRQITNPGDVAGLVVLDTWIRNRDRCSPGETVQNVNNVFLGSGAGVPRGKFELLAIDHGHAFRCSLGSGLERRIQNIEYVQDDHVWGLFPGFQPACRSDTIGKFARKLGGVATSHRAHIQQLVAGLPAEWDVSSAVRAAVVTYLVRRAEFLSEHMVDLYQRAYKLTSGT